MSRSLARIRNLISEIEDIQRHGQQGSRSGPERIPLALAEKAPEPQPPKELPSAPQALPSTLNSNLPETPASSEVVPAPDPFDTLEQLVDSSAKGAPAEAAVATGKISMQLSGGIVLSVQIANSEEHFELSQQGNAIVIQFADGKAFHIPFKAVS